MENEFLSDFEGGLKTGYIDAAFSSKEDYHPQLLVNSREPRKKVLTSILSELNDCQEFFISVAFVTTGGVASIMNTLNDLNDRGVHGKVLVSQYLNFTQPEALRRLMAFSNIELKIATKGNAHSKGYIFRKSEHFSVIVGSSNLTQSALSVNKEWNLHVNGIRESALLSQVLNQFDKDFKEAEVVDERYLEEYAQIYLRSKLHRSEAQEIEIASAAPLKPNKMQHQALSSLSLLRSQGKEKALVISATGTGKTFLSAFDVQSFGAKRMLFVVHRLNIALKAMDSFKKIFGTSRSYGVYSGQNKDKNKDFLFSTIQTISKPESLKAFDKDAFDYIIIDESHRSGAKSYSFLLEYFQPGFLLGMTATPERTDGSDIFQLFDHNIAYEIRLNDAMEEDLLCPFHYYGVSDLFIDHQKQEKLTTFNQLVSKERVEKVIEKSRFFGTDNGIVRGLIFCSRNEEAEKLSQLLNQRGLQTVALSRSSSEKERMAAIERLESDDLREKLDYILSVDIFNEGVDIPKVNQVIMLRPTSSAIIFVQQLGRGLRKLNSKSYLTVIDFIGNHNGNYLIPMALYGDSSYSKDRIRKLISQGSSEIPGVSTINFDRISKEQIFESINAANLSTLKDLRSDYTYLKNRLGRIPMMEDFRKARMRDAFQFVEYSNSYLNFVQKVETDFSPELDQIQIRLLEFLATEINNAKRVEESLILRKLLLKGECTYSELEAEIEQLFSYQPSQETLNSALRNINMKFVRVKKSGSLVPLQTIVGLEIVRMSKRGKVQFTEAFNAFLNDEVFRTFLRDNVNFGIHAFQEKFKHEKWQNGFQIYEKYSRKDVFRIMNFDVNPVAQNVGGYLVSEEHEVCPIFVNYHKEEDISASTKYEDEFLSKSVFAWMSKSNRKLKSKDVQSILNAEGQMRLPLFVKKSNDEGSDFYYIADLLPKKESAQETSMKNDKGKGVSVVRMEFDLSQQVEDGIYKYLLETETSRKTPSPTSVQEAVQFEDSPRQLELYSEEASIPLYDFYAAAGSFSELQSAGEYEMLNVPSRFNPSIHFACKVQGESMNKRIPNGSICIFEKYDGGSRNDKIVLVSHSEMTFADYNSSFTVKTFASKKSSFDDTWEHEAIVLKPNSTDPSFEDIVLDPEEAQNMRVLGIFVEVLS